MLRYTTAGESHGKCLITSIEGIPYGTPLDSESVNAELSRRQGGYGRGARMKLEKDEAEIVTGMRKGHALGSILTLQIMNRVQNTEELNPITRPRPGHADLAGAMKFGTNDARDVAERSSARETAARVALGELARRFLDQALDIKIVSHVVAIGTVCVPDGTAPGPQDGERIDADPVRCLDPATSAAMVHEIDIARKDGDTLGGVVEVLAYGVPPGLGSYVHADRRLDARLAAALMSIQAIKGVEVGDGFQTARRRGSQAHDEIESGPDGLRRRTNRAGGIEGGMSTGEVIRVRAAMKPISTVPRALATVDVRTGEAAKAINQRSDVTAVPAAGVVAEAMVALELAAAAAEKFGGDSVAETARNARAYAAALVIS